MAGQPPPPYKLGHYYHLRTRKPRSGRESFYLEGGSTGPTRLSKKQFRLLKGLFWLALRSPDGRARVADLLDKIYGKHGPKERHQFNALLSRLRQKLRVQDPPLLVRFLGAGSLALYIFNPKSHVFEPARRRFFTGRKI
jgi:hypothetical protein